MRRRLYLVDSFLKFLYHLVVFNFLKLLYNMVVLNFLQPGRFPKATYMALNVEQQLQVDSSAGWFSCSRYSRMSRRASHG